MKAFAHFRILEGLPHVYLEERGGSWRLPAQALEPGGWQLDGAASSVEEFYYWSFLSGSLPKAGGKWLPWLDGSDLLPGPARRVLRNGARLSGRRIVCAVTGRREASPNYNAETALAAEQAGRIAAGFGLAVLTGGLSGVMEKAALGAKAAGGDTLGILPGSDHTDGNSHLDFVLPSGIGIARNYLIANACDLMLALPGGTGTLEEICFALDFKRPVLTWGSWDFAGTVKVPFPDEARLEAAIRDCVREIVRAHYATRETR